MRTNVIFQYAEEFVPLSDQDGILAESDAQWFVSLLRSLPDLYVEDKLYQEDWGVVVFARRHQKRFWIGLSLWPEGQHGWLAHVHHAPFAWFQRLSPSGRRALDRLGSDIHATLASHPGVSEIAWYDDRKS